MAIGAKTTMNSMKADTMKAGGFVQGDNTYPHLNNISTTTTTTSSSSSSQHGVCLQSIWAIPGFILEIESGMDNSYNQCFEKYSEASRYVTADKGGQIAIWRTVKIGDNYFLALIRTFHVSSLEPKPMDYSVRSVCVRDNMILIGLRSSEIFEVNENEVPNLVKKHNRYYSKHGLVSNSTKQVMTSSTSNAAQKKSIDKSLKAQRLNVGHGTGEVWGLAIHPILPVFLTTGDDCTLKCWSLASHKLLSYSRLPDKSRSVDIHPKDGAEFCLSLNSGELWILDMKQMLNPYHRANIPSLDPDLDGDDVTTESISNTESKLKMTEQDGKVSNEKTGKTFKRTILKSDGDPSKGPTSWVQVLRYSFEGSFLAAGSHDNRLYIYMKKASTDTYVLLTWLDHNRSFVTHMDFGVLLNNADAPFEVEKDKSTPTHRRSIRRQSIYDAHSGKVVNVTKHEKLDDNDKVVGTMIKMNRTTANASDVKPTDICIQSTNANSELFFWRCVMKGDSNYDIVPVESAASMKDAYWSTITCPYGWSVQGIWPLEQHNSIDILSVARSHSSNVVQVLATADNHGRLRMYNYPSTIPGDSDKCYRGHAHHITNVQFSRDDEYCISIGGTDKCVFVWKTDIPDEIRERLAYKSMKTLYSLEENDDDDDDVADDDDAIDDQFNLITDKVADENISNVVTFDYQMSMYELSRPSSNAASKQHQQAWKGIVKEPSNWKDPDGSHAEPDADLELKFVYGYRGWDCRNDVKIGTVGHDRFEVVYHVARVGIVLNCEDNTQIHNLEHDHDITCLAIHPPSCIVASGEIGMVPKIVLWDSNTGVTIRTILLHKNGVSNIAFSGSGLIIISTGLDQDRCVAAHSVSTGALLGKSKAGQGVEVFALSVCGDELFMTGGKNHVKFWSLPNPKSPGGEFSSKCGIYSIAEIRSKTIVSSAFLGTDAVTGMSDGMIVLWKDRYTTKHCRAHYGPVTAMNSIDGDTGGIDTKEQGPRVVTAGDDGFVHTWDIQLHKMWTLDLNSTTPKSVNPQIQAVVVRENRLVLGTKASEIYEVSLLNNNDTYRIVQGHFSTREEVAGLAIHPRMNRFITCGDDCTVRLWDSKSKKLVEMMQLEARARAVAIRSDGSQVAVATHNGDLHVLTTDKLIWKLKVTVCSSCLQVLQYSPDSSKVLAVGSDDFTIYLLETNAYGTISILKGHNASVKAIDFSTDGKQLQSNSRDGELLFWDSKTGSN
jgi:WD40 repeat protein